MITTNYSRRNMIVKRAVPPSYLVMAGVSSGLTSPLKDFADPALPPPCQPRLVCPAEKMIRFVPGALT